jgi:hypothetical protein
MMCGLPRKDFRTCERLMSVLVVAGASQSPLRSAVANGATLWDDGRALFPGRLRAGNERRVSELVRGDLG